MAITVYTNPGIGDAYWALMKILPNEEVDLKVLKCSIFRSHFLLQLEGVRSVTEFPMVHGQFLGHAAGLYPSYQKLEPEMYLDVNTWLEHGKRIEKYLPFCNTDFKLKWKFTKESYLKAKDYVIPGMDNVVIYTSSLGNSNGGSALPWLWHRWRDTIQSLYERVPNLNLIWIGAKYDATILPHLEHFKDMKIMVAESPDAVMQLLLQAKCFVTYQSGLSILAVCNSVPTFMLYFDKLDKLRWSWPPPEALNNPGLYKAMLFSEVNQNLPMVADWVLERVKA